MLINEKFKQKLLVEGNDDQHVIWALCEQFHITESFDVIDCTGIEKVIEQIPLRFKQSDIESIGVIIDADTDLKKRFNSLTKVIGNQGFRLPDEFPPDGLVVMFGRIRFGIWIMPNNDDNGMLEDFISFLIPKEDKLFPIVNSTLDSLEHQKINEYQPIHRSKAAIHSWLAWQKDPGTPMGLGITKKYLTTDRETCRKLVNWLNMLYNP